MLLGGVMGAAITWTVIRSMDALGPAKAVLFIVVAQIAAAYVIELFGLFGASPAVGVAQGNRACGGGRASRSLSGNEKTSGGYGLLAFR